MVVSKQKRCPEVSFAGIPYPFEYLKQIWQDQYPAEPMPNIFAYTVESKEFFRLWKVRPSTEIKEYGHKMPQKGIVGFVVKAEVEDGKEPLFGYFVFRREDAPTAEIDILKHEFKHIHDGDI